MAKGQGLQFKTKVDTAESKARLLELKRLIQDVGGISMPSGAASSTSNFTAATQRMNRAMRDSMLETERLRQEGVRLRNEYEAGRITQQQLTAQIRALNEQRRQEAAAARAARTVQVAANGSYQEAQARLRQLGIQIRSVEGGFSNLGRVQQARIAEYNRLNASLLEFDRRMGNHQRNIGNYQSAISGVKGQLAGLVTTYLSAAAAVQLVSSTFTQSLKSAAVRTSLEFTFGSVDLADAKLEQLLDTANRLGVNYNALVTSYKSFTGAVVASNFDFQQGERIFNAVAGASSRLKLSSEDTEGALRALQQMISKGNVQAEELRGQLGERIPGAFSIAARSIGVTETQLNKMLQKGEVLAADLLPALAIELEKTFGLDSTKAVEGMNAETEKFFNMFSGAVAESSNINKFFTTVLKGFNEIFGTIFKTVNSDSWSEFWTRLTVGAGIADTQKEIGKASEQASKAISNTLNLSNKDAKATKFAYEELKLAYENANKALADYREGIAKGTLQDGGAVPLGSLEETVRLTKARMDAVAKLIPKTAPTSKEETAQEKAARLKAEREAERQLNAQRTLQKKITDIQNEASRKTLTKDEEEVQAVKDKFAKITEEIRVFNANPKNKLKVDGSGLAPAMKNQIIAIEYKQDTEKLKESLEVQKGLYEEFESYRATLGEKAAVERFDAEIDVTRKYGDVLQKEYENILANGSKSGFTGAMTERMKVLEKMFRKEGEVESKRQDELMKSIISFDKEVRALNEQYERDRIDVLTKGGGKDLDVLAKNHAKKLAALGDAHLQEIEAFKTLYAGIDRLSDANALKVIGSAEDALKALKAKGVVISKELDAELKRLFTDSRSAISDRLPDRLISLANQIDNVAGTVSGVNEEFGKVLGTVGNVVGQIGNIKKDMLALNKPGATGLEQLTAGLGIFGASVSIFSTVFKMFDRSAQREAQAAYSRDLQNKQTEALNKALERQVALLNDAYGTERITKYNEAISQAIANQAKYEQQLSGRYSFTGDKELDFFIAKLNNGEGFGLDKNTTKNIEKAIREGAKLLPSDLSALQVLLDEGKLDASTANIVTNLIQAKQAAVDLANQLRAERVGAGLDTIVGEFMNALEDGATSLEDTLTKSIRRGLLAGLQGELTRKYIQDFYTQLDSALQDGEISSEEDSQLKAIYKAAEEYGKKKLEYINSVAPETDDSRGQSMAGRIESIRADQADKLVGVFTAVQVNGIRTNVLLAEGNKWMAQTYAELTGNLSDISANTLRTANNTERLKAVESSLASIDRKMGANGDALAGTGRPVI